MIGGAIPSHDAVLLVQGVTGVWGQFYVLRMILGKPGGVAAVWLARGKKVPNVLKIGKIGYEAPLH